LKRAPREGFNAPGILEEADMKIDGTCRCGQITYAAVVDPDTVAICHCKDCQTLTGAASSGAPN
jgi:hypothetical protein